MAETPTMSVTSSESQQHLTNGPARERSVSVCTVQIPSSTVVANGSDGRKVDLLTSSTSKTFWKRRTALEKTLLVTLALLTSALVGTVIAVVVLDLQAMESEKRAGALEAKMASFEDYENANRPSVRRVRNHDICMRPDCVRSAASLLDSLDKSWSPCDDFYQFACGGWLERNPIPETASRWGQFDHLRRDLSHNIKEILEEPNNVHDPSPVKQAKNFFHACMNFTQIEKMGVKPLLDLISRLIPVTPEEQTPPTLTHVLAQLRREVGAHYIVSAAVYLDERNTSHSIVYLDQPSLGLDRSFFNATSSKRSVLEAYRRLTTGVWSVVGALLDVPLEQLNIMVNETLDFETQLAKITTPQELRRNKTRMYNPMTIAQLQHLTDSVNIIQEKAENVSEQRWRPRLIQNSRIVWMDYFTTMFGASAKIRSDEMIIVQEIGFLRRLAALLARTPGHIIANYLRWRLLLDIGPETSEAVGSQFFYFAREVTGVQFPEPRWKICAEKVNHFLGMAVGSRYIRKHFNSSKKPEVQHLVKDLQAAFRAQVDAVDWMDSKTKTAAKKKAATMRQFMAFPDWVLDDEKLEKYYDGLRLYREDHFASLHAVGAWWIRKELDELRKPTDRNKWIAGPSVVNAFYAPNYNSITFPAGILQMPFYGHPLRSLNYGAIGMVIGHEITHGFDDQGRQFDGDGNLAQWWSQRTLDNYLQRSQCFQRQYSNFRVKEVEQLPGNNGSTMVNGLTTLGENMADNGGIRQAFRAFKNSVARKGPEPRLPGLEEYSPEQLFFISFAHVWCSASTPGRLQQQLLTGAHSPGRFRVIGSLQNFQEFSRVWRCRRGSPMNPARKCVLW